jgi:hypothetical protein
MKNLNHLLMLSLFANFAFGETSPNYKVTQIANPPSKFGTKQIDGLDFLPDGRMVVCLPSGEVFFYDPKTSVGSFLQRDYTTLWVLLLSLILR